MKSRGHLQMKVSLVSVVAALCAAQCSCTLFEDQVGTNNWLIENVGDLSDASLHSTAGVATVSAKGVLASLSLLDGGVRWRRDVDIEYMLPSEESNSVVTVGSASVSAWHMPSGQLVWSVPQVANAVCIGEAQAFQYSAGKLSCRSLPRGALTWTTAVDQKTASHAVCSASAATVTVARWSPGDREIQLNTFSSTVGEELEVSTVAAEISLGEQVVIARGALVALSEDGSHLCSVPTVRVGAELSCQQLATPDRGAVLSAAFGLASLQGSKQLTIFSVSGNVPKLLSSHAGISISSGLFQYSGEGFVATAKTAGRKLSLSVLDAASGKSLHSDTIQEHSAVDAEGHMSPVSAVWAVPDVAGTGERAFK